MLLKSSLDPFLAALHTGHPCHPKSWVPPGKVYFICKIWIDNDKWNRIFQSIWCDVSFYNKIKLFYFGIKMNYHNCCLAQQIEKFSILRAQLMEMYILIFCSMYQSLLLDNNFLSFLEPRCSRKKIEDLQRNWYMDACELKCFQCGTTVID